MDREVVDAMVGGFYAVAGRNLQELTLPMWERILDDLPDVWVTGEHLAHIVALELLRDSDGLVTPKQFRAAYRARSPKLGHADECHCGGAGMVEVDASSNRWARCSGPLVGLPERDDPALLVLPKTSGATARAVADFSKRFRQRSPAAVTDRPGGRALPVLRERQPWHRPDEAYWEERERRRLVPIEADQQMQEPSDDDEQRT
jgi:hypothetical protein